MSVEILPEEAESESAYNRGYDDGCQGNDKRDTDSDYLEGYYDGRGDHDDSWYDDGYWDDED